MHQRGVGDGPDPGGARKGGGRSWARRLLTAVTVVATVAAGTVTVLAGTASATGLTVGTLPISLASPPAALLNQIALGTSLTGPGLYTATAAEQASLEALEQQAVTDTLADHGLPSSTAGAVQTWGRDDAEGELWALVTEAVQAVAAGTATTNQTNVVDWLATVVQRQDVQSADDAGLEYAKWAGLGASNYETLLAGKPSESSLQSFLSGTPLTYGAGESLSTPESTSNEGYCVYESPALATSGYSSSIYGSNAPQLCFTGCTSVLGCTPPTPTYNEFVQWGSDDADASTFDNPSFAAVANDVAESIGFGAAVVGATVTGVVLSSTLAGALNGTALAAALSPFGGVSGGAVGALGSEALAEASAGIAAADVAGVVAIVIAAIAIAVIEGLNVFSAAALPGKLATLVADAPTTTPDVASMLATSSQASGLYALFIGATLPEPLPQSCDNTFLISSTADPNPAPCLNAPAIPAQSAGDPAFTVTEKGSTTSTTSDTISWADSASETKASAYVTGDWWVENETADSDGSSTTFQSLRIHYTNWAGDEEIAWLVGNTTSGYTFVSTQADATTPVSPSTCVADGSCSASSTLDYVGTDGNDYSASISGTGVPVVPPGGTTSGGVVFGTSTSLTASPQVAQTGEPVTLTAAVTGFFGGTGTVTFVSAAGKVDTTLCTVTSIPIVSVPEGPVIPGYIQVDQLQAQATCTATFTSGGTQDLYATFSGPGFSSSQSELTLDVSASSATSTSVTASSVDPSPGQPVTYVATVSDVYGPGATPGGTVSFSGGDTECADIPLTLTTSGYQAGCQVTYGAGATSLQSVTASYSGDASTSRSSGSTEIEVIQGAQQLSFSAPATGTYGGSAVLSAAGGQSGNPVTFALDPTSGTGVCSLSGTDDGTVSYTGVGNCVIDAEQAGDASYSAAPEVQQTIAVGPATPAITWAAPAAITYGTALGPQQLDATSAVSGSFTYTANGSSVTSGEVLDAGKYTLGTVFTPSNGTDYTTAAASVPLTVQPAKQTITWSTLPEAGYGQPAFSVASDASVNTGLPLTFSGTGACSVTSAGVVTVQGSGTCAITASQAGTTEYSPATAIADLVVAAVGLRTSASGAQAYQQVTLSAAVASSLSAAHSTLEIVDQTTGKVLAKCTTGTSCTTTTSNPTGMQSYVAELLSSKGATTATSPAVVVVWAAPTVKLSASPGSPTVAQKVTLTATSSESLTHTPLSLVIYNPATGQLLASCSGGTTCTATVAEPSPQTFDAAIVEGPGVQVQLGAPATVTVNWPRLTVALAAGATSAKTGRPVPLTATANGDISATGYAILIVDTTNPGHPQVIAACVRGTSCSVPVIQFRSSSRTFEAEIGDLNGTHVVDASAPVSVTWG